jgi:hypothetical protein
MPTPPPLRITLELQAGGEPPRGSVQRPGGEPRPFWGWLQLIQAIEDAMTNAQGGSHEDRHSHIDRTNRR